MSSLQVPKRKISISSEGNLFNSGDTNANHAGFVGHSQLRPREDDAFATISHTPGNQMVSEKSNERSNSKGASIKTSTSRPQKKVTFALDEGSGNQLLETQNSSMYGSMNSVEDDSDAAPMTHSFVSPSLEKGSIRMRSREERTRAARAAGLTSSVGTVSNPDFADTLRRVSVVVQQHIVRGERLKRRHERMRAQRKKSLLGGDDKQDIDDIHQSPSPVISFSSEGPVGLIESKTTTYTGAYSNRDHPKPALQMTNGARGEGARGDGNQSINPATTMPLGERLAASANFHEAFFVRATWQYTFVRAPGLFLSKYQLRKVEKNYPTPEVGEIHGFIKNLFMKGQLSAECSVVCLIYVERLMENAGIELLASNWRPIMLCGLLLASKVWQDLSTWNVEFESISPDFSLKSINRLERTFLKYLRYSLFISGSVYARYYFALRSLTEKKDFRRRYNQAILGSRPVPNSQMIEARSDALKNQVLSRSM